MPLPDLVLDPPFHVTRAGHIVLEVADLEASREFYCDVVGLLETDRTADALYLRGLEEVCHHSLVLRKGPKPGLCQQIGLRVLTEDDLDRAAHYFKGLGLPADFVEVPHQDRTLQVRDPFGMPIEFVASMDMLDRPAHEYQLYRGGAAQRLDHYQFQCSRVQEAADFYAKIGFRISEYAASGTDDELWAVFFQRKGNPHDIVFANGPGPRLHHFAYTIRDSHDLIHLCDTAGALGHGLRIERGPGRHGMAGGALFVYFRDPDGHRIECFNTHYQTIDIEEVPVRWDITDPKRSNIWGPPAIEKWFKEASEFSGATPEPPRLKAMPETLEQYLGLQQVG